MEKAKCFYSVTLFVNGENMGGFTLSEDEADTVYDALNEYTDPEQEKDDNPTSTVMAKFNTLWETPVPRTDKMSEYTVFCIEKSRQGTTWVATVKAYNPEQAAWTGRVQCAADWGFKNPEDIHVLSVAEGEVKILQWHD